MSAQSTVLLSGSSSAWTARKSPKNETERKKRIERFSLRKTRGYCYKSIPSFARGRVDLDELVNETYLVWRVYRLVYRNKPQYLAIKTAARIACGRIMRQLFGKATVASKYKQLLWDRFAARKMARDAVVIGKEYLAGSLNPKHSQLLDLLILGYTKGECAAMLGVSAPRVSAMVRKIGEAYQSSLRDDKPAKRIPTVKTTRKVDFTPNGARFYRPPQSVTRFEKSTELEREQFRNCPQYYGSIVE